jgi:hypothetical protein
MRGFHEKRVKKVRLTFCTFGTTNFFTPNSSEVFGCRRETKCGERKVTVAKRQNRAGATPLFRGEAAQKFPGVAPALRHEFSCRPFCHGERIRKGDKDMPIVKKAPGLITREVKLEEPVNQLLEDYARFIESSTDHVINSVLKKLWRDQDYRKWRDARRATQPAVGGKSQATEPGARS